VEVDEELADRLIEHSGGLLARSESAHDGEHSIEVQMPFLRHFFPEAKAVPISVLPTGDAAAMGTRVGASIKENGIDAAVVGTTDLTHYGDVYGYTPAGRGPQAHEWMRSNDACTHERMRSRRDGGHRCRGGGAWLHERVDHRLHDKL
jgi:AmmeMemoRadiSam system protein B